MKMFLISDNEDTKLGMRLAGIEGVVVHTREEVRAAMDEVLTQEDIGILLMTGKLSELVPDYVKEIKLNYHLPLIVEIPDRHGFGKSKEYIAEYIRSAIGVDIGGG